METPWQLITEEVRMFIEERRTRLKNAARRIKWFAVPVFLVACGGSYEIHKHWVIPHLTPPQRFYFGQYWDSSYKSYLPNTTSEYTILARTIADPDTKREMTLPVTDAQVEVILGDEGRLLWDTNHLLDAVFEATIKTKDGVDDKSLVWLQQSCYLDAEAYKFFRDSIYDNRTIPRIWCPAWIGAIVIFGLGMIAIAAGDQIVQRVRRPMQ